MILEGEFLQGELQNGVWEQGLCDFGNENYSKCSDIPTKILVFFLFLFIFVL